MASVSNLAFNQARMVMVCVAGLLIALDITATSWAQPSVGSKGESRVGRSLKGLGNVKAAPSGAMSYKPTEGVVLSRPINPEKYVLGPGDQLIINLWGEYDSSEAHTVSAEGKVSIPTIGDLKFKGLTLAEAEALLKKQVAKYYRNVNSGISLTALRSFVVPVLGSVHQPGNYVATLDKRVSDLIETAGGVLPGGSQRHIQVLQDGKVRVTSDLSAFLRRGRIEANPYLQDGDVIYVPPVQGPFITIFDDAKGIEEGGSIALPITYELAEGQRFSSILSDLGGINPAWDIESVYILRQQPGAGEAQRISINLAQLIVQSDGFKDIELRNGDRLIFPVDLRRPFVNGLGEVIDLRRGNR